MDGRRWSALSARVTLGGPGRWLGASATVVAAAVLAACAPSAPPLPYTELKGPDGTAFINPSQINERGQVIGGHYSTVPSKALVWERGQVTELDVRSPDGATTADISETGQVVGREAHRTDPNNSDQNTFTFQPLSWSAGVRTVLPTDGGSGWAVAVNDSGLVLGRRWACPPSQWACLDHPSEAWVWRDGEIIKPPPVPDREMVPVDINNRGQVLVNIRPWEPGTYVPEESRPLPVDRGYAAVWQIGGGITELRTSVTSYSEGVAINERGDVAGQHYTGKQRGFLWRDGQLIDLDAPDALTTAVSGRRAALNERGDVVGSVRRMVAANRAVYRAALWQGGRLTEFGPTGSDLHSSASAVNDLGQVVGSSWTDWQPGTGLLWSGGAIRVLGTLPSDTKVYTSPVGINEQGQIVGSAQRTTADAPVGLLWNAPPP